MYSRGEYVVYRRMDVCAVTDVAQLRAAGQGLYYHLRPLAYEGMIYVPVGEEGGLRALITPDGARRLLSALGDMPAPVSNARDRRALEEHYRALMRPNDCPALARTIKSLRAKQRMGRHLSSLEEQLLHQSELALLEELSVALGQSEDSVRAQLMRALSPGLSA